MMRICLLAVVVILGAAAVPTVRAEDKLKAPAAAAKPAEPLDGMRVVVALIPKDLWPDQRQGFTELQRKAANDWVRENLSGRAVKVNGPVESVDATGDNVSVGMALVSGVLNNHRWNGRVTLRFPASAAAQLRTLRPGSPLIARGVISEAQVSTQGSNDGPLIIFTVGVALENVTVIRGK